MATIEKKQLNGEVQTQQGSAPQPSQQTQQPAQGQQFAKAQADATAQQWQKAYESRPNQQQAVSDVPQYNAPHPDTPAQMQPSAQPAQPQSQPDYAAAMKSTAEQWQQQAQAQAQKQIDYATQQGITELERAKEDAQEQFKTQQKQIARDEAMAKDNSALYAEMRGDKGGIGQAQYNAIANTAAINRQTVAGQQSKLSTDTARQIADLRAKGEFDKADKLLEISQNYLTQLMSLEQWAMEYGLSAEQFNEAVRQWETEFQNTVNQQGVQNEQWQKSHDESIRQWEAEFGNLQSEQIRDASQWQQQFEADQNQLAFENQLAQDKFKQDVLERERAAEQWREEFERLKSLDNVSAEQWKAEFLNMLDQQDLTAEQWEKEFENMVKQQEIGNAMDEAALTGKYNGELTLQGKNQIADMAMVLMDAGIGLSDEQLSALGISREQLEAYQAGLISGTGGGYAPDDGNTGEDAKKSYHVAGLGEISDKDALNLVNQGYLEVTGKDKYGAPIIKTTAKYSEAVKKGDNSVIAGIQSRK